jgi:hypothetical protein
LFVLTQRLTTPLCSIRTLEVQPARALDVLISRCAL